MTTSFSKKKRRRNKCYNTDLDVDYNGNGWIFKTFGSAVHSSFLNIEKKSLLPVLKTLMSSCSSLIANKIYKYERRHLKWSAWALGYYDSQFSPSSDISLDKKINWKLICSPFGTWNNKTAVSRCVLWSALKLMWLRPWQMKSNIGSISEQVCTVNFSFLIYCTRRSLFVVWLYSQRGAEENKNNSSPWAPRKTWG